MPTKEERQKIKDAVRMLDPAIVAAKIGLADTRTGWVCPECGNGSGSSKTGIVPKYLSKKGDHVEWSCFVCHGTWDNIALAAKVKLNYSVDDKGNFNNATDFPKALDEVAQLFGVTLDAEGKVHCPHAIKHPEIFDDAEDDVDESELKDYSAFYSFAASGLKYFMQKHDDIYRGIPKKIYEYFWCGWTHEFGKAKTPAFIIPTSRRTFLARFTGDKEKLTDEQRANLKEKWRPFGVSRPPFNIKRATESKDPIIFLFEGEFDAISVFYGSLREEFLNANGVISLSNTPRVNTMALMSTAVAKKFYRRLKADVIGKKYFVVLLDNDDAGIKATPKVVSDLKALGHDAVGVLLSEKFNDANDFLQAEPENFSARIKEIYDAAKAGTLTTDEIFTASADDKHGKTHAQEPEIKAESTAPDKSVERPKNEDVSEYERLSEARANLETLFKGRNHWHGIRKETAGRLTWGILQNYDNPIQPDWEYVLALIIPNDKGGAFALELTHDNIGNGTFGEKKLLMPPTSVITISRPTADKILLVVENPIDGASIAQATNFQYGIIAIGDTNADSCIERLKEMFPDDAPKPKTILLLEDETKLLPQLRSLGFPAVKRAVDDEKNRCPNQILFDDEDAALRTVIEKIIDSAREDLTQLDASTGKKITRWQNENGVIDPELLTKLKKAAARIDALKNITAANARDTTTQKYLGAFLYYSFFVPTYQKFIVGLRDAKNAANAKIKAWGKDKSQPEPTDDDKAVAAINIKSIESAIEKFKTDASRKHREFLDILNAKTHEAELEAERQKYLEDKPTTQKIISDCPVNLEIPQNVIFDKAQIGVVVTDKDGDTREEIGALTPAVPTKILRDATDDTLEYEIAVYSKKVWRHHIFAAKSLTARSIDCLADVGISIEDSKFLSKYFARLISMNEDALPETAVYKIPGWHGDTFIYPVAAETDNYIVRRNGIDYKSIFTTRGDKLDWLQMFLGATTSTVQGELKRIVIGACLLAPLLKILGIKNPQFNIWGGSNRAKTLVPKIGLSVFGDPTEGKMMRTWGGTAKNRMSMAAGFCDLPQMVDEAESMTQKSRDELSAAIYEFHGGTLNQANKRNGNVRNAESFRSVRLSTAETPMHTESDKKGNFKRLIDLYVGEEFFPDKKARDIHLFLEKNHGHYGRQWVDYIVQNCDQIKDDFESLYNHFELDGFERDGRPAQFKSIDATNARAIIASSVAFWHFRCCADIDDVFDTIDARRDAGKILGELPSTSAMSDVKRAIGLLESWLLENPGRISRPYTTESGTVGYTTPDSYKPSVARENNDGSYYFFSNEFKNVIEKDLGLPSLRKLLTDLYEIDALDCDDKSTKSKRVYINGKRTRVYAIKSGVFFVDEIADEEVYAACSAQ